MKKEPLIKRSLKKNHVNKDPQSKKQVKINKYADLIGLSIIILLGIIIYSNSINCLFQFDDFDNIVNNTKIRNFSDVKAWWNFSPKRPVGIFTFALNYHFNQLDVRYWHLVNLIIHLINACLVWWLTLLIFSSPAMKDHPVVKHKKVLAFLTALLFVSHPLATQSVTYIVQRLNSMAAMFYLLSLALYVKARLSTKGNISQFLLFAASLISAVLAMLTKENAFTLPFSIVLFEIFFLRTKKLSITGINPVVPSTREAQFPPKEQGNIPSVPSARDGIVRLSIPQSGMQVSRINFKDYRTILWIAAFLGVIFIIPLKYSFNVFKPIPPSIWHLYTLTPFNYLLTQFSVIVKYIQLLFLPINQKVDYDFPISNYFFEIKTLLSFFILSSLIILAILLFKRNRVISFGIFWFFLTLSIESSFIPINDVIYEHRTYLPSFGFFLIISSTFYYLLWDKYKFLAFAILVIIIGSNSYMTYERNKVWKDPLTLWNDNVAKAPNIVRPIINRGIAYKDLGQWDKAIADYSRAIGIDPKNAKTFINRGVVYWNFGQWDKAIADYSMAIDLEPQNTIAYYNRGIAYWKLGQWDNAIADYSKAIEIDPTNTNTYSNRGVVYGILGQWDKVIADYSTNITINPKDTEGYYNRGVAYGNLRQWDKAITDYSKAIELDPKYAKAIINRSVAYGNIGQWEKVIADCSMAIDLEPQNTIAYSNRGIAYGSLGQWDKAIADYSKAIEIDPNYTNAYINRNIAYKRLGKGSK